MLLNLYRLVLLLAIIVIYFSCSNPTENSNPANNIIPTIRIYNPKQQLISNSDLDTVKILFHKNNLDLSGFQVWLFGRDVNNPGEHFVFCNQFYNDLLVFNKMAIFRFNILDVYYSQTGELFTVTKFDTIPKITSTEAGRLFYSKIASDTLFKDSLTYFENTWITAELGIFDLNSSQNNAPEKYVLTWKLEVTNGKKHPTALIRADSSYIISYINRRPTR